MTDDLNIPSLGRYLEASISGFRKLTAVEKFPGGQSNPTYKLEAHSGHYVLRRKPFGELLKSAHAVDREYRVLSALSASKVPVGKALHLCLDESIVGSMFYVMEHLDGDVHWAPTLPEMTNKQRARIYDELNKIVAAVHTVDIESIDKPIGG